MGCEMGQKKEEIYQFKITLKGIRPPIWRRIQVPGDYTFWDLHVAIQDVMGWYDMHLHAFEIINPKTKKMEEIGIPDDEYPSTIPVIAGWDLEITRYFTMENSKAMYVYDFGDDWCHNVKLEKILPREDDVVYPRCLGGRRAAPPEDCGGSYGYLEMMEIINDPEHEEYEDMREWLDESFDPEHFDKKEIEFSDPQKRLDEGYPWNDDSLIDGDDYGDDSTFVGYVEELREYIKAGKMDLLDPEEQRFARAFSEHEELFTRSDDYHDTFRSMEELILHAMMHSIVETEIKTRNPVEVFHFHKAMTKQKVPPHMIVHIIGSIVMPLMVNSMNNEEPFDLERYTSLLNTFTFKKPEEVLKLITEEFYKELH